MEESRPWSRLGAIALGAVLLVVLLPSPAEGDHLTEGDVRTAEVARDQAYQRFEVAELAYRTALIEAADHQAGVARLGDAIQRLSAEREVVAQGLRSTVIDLYVDGRAPSFAVQEAAVKPAYEEFLATDEHRTLDDLLDIEREIERLLPAYDEAMTTTAASVDDLRARRDAAQGAFGEAQDHYLGTLAQWEEQERERLRRVEEERMRELAEEERRQLEAAARVAAEQALTEARLDLSQAYDRLVLQASHPRVQRWRQLVEEYFPAHRVEEAMRVIACESRGIPTALHPETQAAGLFQHMPEWWENRSAAAGFAGAGPYDPEANIATAALLVRISEFTHPWGPWGHWVCQPDGSKIE